MNVAVCEAEEACPRPVKARGLCEVHYWRLRKSGLPLPPRLRDRTRTMTATWGQVSRQFEVPELVARRIHVVQSGCWEWTSHIDKQGYSKHGTGLSVHLLLYRLLVSSVSDGLQLDHLCRVNRCCNPLHLEPVTDLENKRRRYSLVTHCVNNHEFTSENTYIRPASGHRDCRTCIRDRARAYAERKRGAA